MSVLDQSIDTVRNIFRPASELLRKRLLGANNERLDFIMDSFYKLSPKQQSTLIVVFFSAIVALVIMIFSAYFIRISALESDLNSGYEALRSFRNQADEYKIAAAKLEWVKQNVESKTADLRPKPFFEQTAKKIGVTLEGLNSEDADLSKDNPLAPYFKEIQVKFRMPKVSIPRLLKFISEIEKSGKTLSLKDLKIRALFGDRLYFDVEAVASGYKKI